MRLSSIFTGFALLAPILPVAIAFNPVFGASGTRSFACQSCLDRVVNNVPSKEGTKAFATYMCIGQGGSEAAVCLTGSCVNFLGDIIDLAANQADILLITSTYLGYCYRFFPAETCEVVRATELWASVLWRDMCTKEKIGTVESSESGPDSTNPNTNGGQGSKTKVPNTAEEIDKSTSDRAEDERDNSPNSAAMTPVVPWQLILGLALFLKLCLTT